MKSTLTSLLLCLSGQAIAQTVVTSTATSTFSTLVIGTQNRRQIDTYSTRVIGRTASDTLFDQTFDLPPGAPDVLVALEKARVQLYALPGVTLVSGPKQTNGFPISSSRNETVRTGVVRTIGVTLREAVGPTTIVVGALATEDRPCSFTGGTPILDGGLTPGDGFQFHFTTPIVPTRCPLPGTPFIVAENTRNIDTLTHIHSTISQTLTTTTTTLNSTRIELVATIGPPDTIPAPETKDIGILSRYVSNLDLGDAILNLTNSGARGANLAAGISANTTGAICVNVYAFTGDDQLVNCCSCAVTPNGLVTLSARKDLIPVAYPAPLPNQLVVKLYPTVPIGGSCSSSAWSPGETAPGLHAWATSIQTDGKDVKDITETPFLPTSSAIGEREQLASRCAALSAGGSGFGICRSCRLGGIDAGRLN